jgi:hypothetical protein
MLLLVPPQFLAVAALVLLSDCIGAPVGAIVDATVVGACKTDGDYGEHTQVQHQQRCKQSSIASREQCRY